MDRFNKLTERVIIWAYQRDIFKVANPLAQIEKTLEEVHETKEAIFSKQQGLVNFEDSKGRVKVTKDEIIDGLGDTLVTLLIQCEMQDLNLLDCLESALNVIEKRTGKMKNGKFIKDEK